MTSREFCYWLQGYFEIHGNQPMPPEPHGGDGLNSEQVKMIQRHLSMVFTHEIDPSYPEQEKLNHLHAGKNKPIVRC